MKRTFPTLALIGVAALGTLGWQQAGLAEDDSSDLTSFVFATDVDPETAAARQAVPAPDIRPGPFADDIRALLATPPGPERDAAAERYRALGPEAFAALYEALAPAVAHYRALKSFAIGEGHRAAEPLVRLLDQVAQQRDAYAAGLYWYTDLEQAKARAQETGRPILSLRMLGHLDEEYSCANSRFFRTVLYADTALGDTLRERFVLHWHSVRPVPVITIDMGDGRVLRRTITGNSCHLVLDPQGRPVDVIPGLYGPRTFEQQVARAAGFVEEYSSPDDPFREIGLQLYHMQAREAMDRAWREQAPSEVRAVLNRNVLAFAAQREGDADGASPDALDAGIVAAGKYQVERPLVRAALSNVDSSMLAEVYTSARLVLNDPDDEPANRDSVASALAGGFIFDDQPEDGLASLVLDGDATQDEGFLRAASFEAVSIVSPQNASAEVWDAVAAYYAEGAELDEASRALMREKTATAEQAMARALSKSIVEDPLLAMVRNFENAIALDTARNEHLLHRAIHQWFIDGTAPMDVDALTSRVYAELFLTPDEDPWLGLVPADTYSALDAGGLDGGE